MLLLVAFRSSHKLLGKNDYFNRRNGLARIGRLVRVRTRTRGNKNAVVGMHCIKT
ncbi:hypothetical protein HanRHA438_Chr17g0800341 [Helianthus annuus]|nr:hypothetical protein HanHA89_Chr17g0695631 [Helianthus annuus]KAJ0825183.1 hypothetical protein HanRHA438_Chr17g0800341 [Helianthus annuus]